MADALHDLIVNKAPSEYKITNIEPTPGEPVYGTPDWEEPLNWMIDGKAVSIHKAIVIPVTLTSPGNPDKYDYLVVGYVGAGGS